MTWTKLSDDFTDDCWGLSDAAFRLHTAGLIWSNRKLLDLRIPKDDLPRLAKNTEALAELLAGGLWTDEGDHLLIRHHALYQRRREDVIKQQDANARNGARGGRPVKPGREQFPAATKTHSLSDSKTERDRAGQDWAVNDEHEFNDSVQVNAETGEVSSPVKDWPTAAPGGGGGLASQSADPTGHRTCSVPDCGNKLYTRASICRRGDEAHQQARAAA